MLRYWFTTAAATTITELHPPTSDNISSEVASTTFTQLLIL